MSAATVPPSSQPAPPISAPSPTISTGMKIKLPDGTERSVYFIVRDSSGKIMDTRWNNNPEILKQCAELFQKLVEAAELHDGSPARTIESVSTGEAIKYTNATTRNFRTDDGTSDYWKKILNLLTHGTPEGLGTLTASLADTQ
jgi:hypothetical protein